MTGKYGGMTVEDLKRLSFEEQDRFCMQAEMDLTKAMMDVGFTIDEMNEINQSIVESVCGTDVEMMNESVH